MKIFVLLFLSVFNTQAIERKIQVVEARFEKVETGDYIHLVLSGSKNERISLVCEDLPKNLVKGIGCNELQKQASYYKNKILKVSYYEETKFIPEAQEKITWKWVDRIDLK